MIKSSNCEKVLGVKINTKLAFDDHKDMWRKASNKLCALGRVTPYVGLGKKLLMNSFFAAQCNYYPPNIMDVPQSNQQENNLFA